MRLKNWHKAMQVDWPGHDNSARDPYTQISEDVRYLTTPADGSCGIGMYTQQLIDSFKNGSPSKTTFRPNTASFLTYLYLPLKVIRRKESIIHVQFEYGLYCEEACQRLSVPAIVAIFFFPLLRLLSILYRKQIVTTVHTVYNSESEDRPWYGIIYLKLLHSTIALTSEKVILLSKESRENFENDILHGETEVMPHGADMDKSASISPTDAKATFGYENDETIIALPGYIEHRKGHRRFINLAEQLPDYEFLIGGGARTDRMESFEEQIRHEKGENVQITGILEEEMFHQVFQAADVVVLPYWDIDQSGIFNWCAVYQTPVVTTDLPYFERLNADWNCVDIVGNEEVIDRLAATVEKIVTSESHRRELESGLRAYRKANSFKTVAEAHAEIYKECVS